MSRTAFVLTEAERRAPRALVEHALLLIGRIHHAGPEAARAAESELQRWRQAAPAHAEAAATAQRIWNATGADALRGDFPLPPTARQERHARRRAMGLLGVTGLLALVGAGGHWHRQRPVYETALRTDQGQTLAHSLPDGSTLDLAARTALQVTYHRDRRAVRLLEGEARFDIAPDAQRPFSVETAWGRVRVLGTVFTVSARAGRMHVAVARGRVAVWAAGAGANAAPAAILQAGEAIEAGAQGAGQRFAVAVDEVADWKQGWLVFRNTPLHEAVARWNDYLSQPLRLADGAALHNLRVTGSYPLRNPQAFIDSLPSMLPVQVERTGDGGARISARR